MKKVLDNQKKRFIIAVFYRAQKVYYISISSACFSHHITNSIGKVRDYYICFCKKHSFVITPYKSQLPCFVTDEQDLSSWNNSDSWLVRYIYHSYTFFFSLNSLLLFSVMQIYVLKWLVTSSPVQVCSSIIDCYTIHFHLLNPFRTFFRI